MKYLKMLFVFLNLVACGSGTETRSAKEKKTQASAGALQAYAASPKAIMTLNYRVDVKMNSFAPCKGEVTLELLSNFSLSFPKGMAENNLVCFGIIPIPIGSILGGVTGGFSTPGDQSGSGKPSIIKDAQHDGMTLYLGSLGSAQFEPPRPVLLGPVVTDKAKYSGYSTSVNTTKIVDGKEDPGTISIRVLDLNAKYQSPIREENNFDDVLVWEMKSEGFKTSALKGLTLPKITWHWNTLPIIIPKIQVELSSADLMPKEGITGVLGSISERLLGKITIDLDVLDYSQM